MGRNTTLYSGQSISERLATPRRKIEVCVEPGKPWQNAVAESFNGKFRDECLSLEWFRSAEAVSRRRHTRIGAPAIATGVELPPG
jgi:transposase InsO family protein